MFPAPRCQVDIMLPLLYHTLFSDRLYLCWLRRTFVLAFGVLRLIERAFLPKRTAEKYNPDGLKSLDFLPFCFYRRRRGSVSVSYGHYHQATSLSQLSRAKKRFLCWVKPPTTSLLLGTLADFARGKSEVITETHLYDSDSSSSIVRSSDQFTGRWTDFSWCSSPKRVRPGNKPFTFC